MEHRLMQGVFSDLDIASPQMCMAASHCRRVSGPVTGTLPTAYSSWTSLKAFELSNTMLNGTIPAAYTTAWLSLENFTLNGAMVSGYVPDPFSWSNLTWYTVQNTAVYSDALTPFWIFKSQAANLRCRAQLAVTAEHTHGTTE
jgi:hypothetical protein